MQVTRLSLTPVKGFALHHPERIEVGMTGAVGDRDFFLVDEQGRLVSVVETGELMSVSAAYEAETQRLRFTVGPDAVVDGAVDGAVHGVDDRVVDGVIELGPACTFDFYGLRPIHAHLVQGPWAEFASDLVGRRVRLIKADEPCGGRDVDPLTLLGAGSVEALAQHAGFPIDARRFRMLIEFDEAPAFAEDAWHGHRLRIGSTVIEVGGPVRRCAGTTRHPDSGAIDCKTLTIIGSVRGRQESIFGLGFNLGVYARCIDPGWIAVGDVLRISQG